MELDPKTATGLWLIERRVHFRRRQPLTEESRLFGGSLGPLRRYLPEFALIYASTLHRRIPSFHTEPQSSRSIPRSHTAPIPSQSTGAILTARSHCSFDPLLTKIWRSFIQIAHSFASGDYSDLHPAHRIAPGARASEADNIRMAKSSSIVKRNLKRRPSKTPPLFFP